MSAARELRDLAAAYGRGVAGDVVATIVDVRGSSYKKPGARAILRARGGRVGTVSGGCLERDLARRAAWLTERGPRVVRYDTSIEDAEEGGTSLGCGGSIALLVERAGSFHPALAGIAEGVLRDEPVHIATVVEGPNVGASVAIAGGARFASEDAPVALADAAIGASRRAAIVDGVFVELVAPPPRLVVCGDGEDAVALRELAERLGYVVRTCGREVSPASIPTAKRPIFAVVMTHSLPRDRAWLDALLPREDVGYVGLLGPRHRAEHLLGAAIDDSKLHAPVGLRLGGEGPQAIALAIVAEIESVRSTRPSAQARACERRDPSGSSDRRTCSSAA